MMSEKKFKVGDRVRVDLRGQESAFVNPPQYKEGTIIGCGDYGDGDEYAILICEYEPDRDMEFASEDNLTLIKAFDPRTAFLQELKELLTKYNVEIDGGCLGWDSEDPFVSFDSKYFKLAYCEEYCSKFKFPLTPDNIMDYE